MSPPFDAICWIELWATSKKLLDFVACVNTISHVFYRRKHSTFVLGRFVKIDSIDSAPEGRTDLRSFRIRAFRFRSSYAAINLWG
jgi:hypothetical protein